MLRNPVQVQHAQMLRPIFWGVKLALRRVPALCTLTTYGSRYLFAMPAAERGGDAVGIFDALHQHVDAIRSPEQFAVEHHGGHAEHAECFGIIDDAIVLGVRSAVSHRLRIRRPSRRAM